jgi:hypothetical protein
MLTPDAQRGRVIGAAWHLYQFLRENVGPTRDWPVRLVCDDRAIEKELMSLLNSLRVELDKLKEVPDDPR